MQAPKIKYENREIYLRQNKMIHLARAQINMDLDDCRTLAEQISGAASISSLSLSQRWELIEMLKAKGARVHNPRIPRIDTPRKELLSEVSVEDVYPKFLDEFNRRFPNERPGYASNKQLAWLKALWELDFNDGRDGNGLRGFIYRQTKGLPDGPVSDLAFLKSHHVASVMMPLKNKASKGQKKRA